MAYIVPIHKPSGVSVAIKLKFFDNEHEALVVVKSNQLEFYSQDETGISLITSTTINGVPILLNKLRPASSITDQLFVVVETFKYFVLSWDNATQKIKTEYSNNELTAQPCRETSTGYRCDIDATRRFMALEIYLGVINIIPIVAPGKKPSKEEIGTLCSPPISCRLPELHIISSGFLYRRLEKDLPRIALLYRIDASENSETRLRIRELVYTAGLKSEGRSVDMEKTMDVQGKVELGAAFIIPLGAPVYGFLVIGETSIAYVDEFDLHLRPQPLTNATIFVAWERIDQQRFVLADEYGKIYMLMVTLNNRGDYGGWKLEVLGNISRPTTLVYLDGGRLFVGSHQGDSMVVQINAGSVETIQILSNVAPILDFTVMDMGNRTSDAQVNEFSSGQARLVTGSGAFQNGGLRSVRSGVSLEVIGTIAQISQITALFGVKRYSSDYMDTLVISLPDQTRVFSFTAEGEAEECMDYLNLDLAHPTILAQNISDHYIVHVSSHAVILLDQNDQEKCAVWDVMMHKSIIAATITGNEILLNISGSVIVLLRVEAGKLVAKAEKEFEGGAQISCISLSALLPNVAFVGLWDHSSILTLNTHDLSIIHTETLSDDSLVVPRSLMIAQLLIDASPTLLIGMADGTVVTYSINSASYCLSDKKVTILGTQQPNFSLLPRNNGLENVFATCEHPSLIYGSDERINFSAITAGGSQSVCLFDSEAFPGAVAIATDDVLKLAVVDEKRTTHIQTWAMNETVRRVVYSLDMKAFGLCTIKRQLVDNTEVMESSFKLVDEIAFQHLDSFALDEDELIEHCINAKLDDGSGTLLDRFIIGTSYMDDGREANFRGRIIILEVTKDRKLKLVYQIVVKGACRALAICQGRLVAALIKTVVIYAFRFAVDRSAYLEKVCTYRTATAPIDLSIQNNEIVVADLMKSISVLRYKPSDGKSTDTLTEISRHYDTLWSTSVTHIDKGTYLLSDAEKNVIVLYHDTETYSEADKRHLRVLSEIHLGEMVNRIRPISVTPSPTAVIVPKAFLATVDGSIFLFGTIREDQQDLLMRLQANMAEMLETVGGLGFNEWRGFKTLVRACEEPNRFVDGDLLERFLECGPELQGRIVQGLGTTKDEVKALVEGLKRLH